LPLSLVVLPTEVNIDIISHLAATSKRAMDDLRSLRATCREMCRVCNNAAVGWRAALERFAVELQWNDRKGYDALLDCLTRIRNSEACFLSGMVIHRQARGGRPGRAQCGSVHSCHGPLQGQWRRRL
jgi:hypothetical protein